MQSVRPSNILACVRPNNISDCGKHFKFGFCELSCFLFFFFFPVKILDGKKGLPELSWKCDFRYERKIFLVDKILKMTFCFQGIFLKKLNCDTILQEHRTFVKYPRYLLGVLWKRHVFSIASKSTI